MRVIWFIAGCFSLLAVFTVLVGFSCAESAIQECSVTSTALCFTIIPYCFARSVEKLARKGNK